MAGLLMSDHPLHTGVKPLTVHGPEAYCSHGTLKGCIIFQSQGLENLEVWVVVFSFPPE